MRKIFCIGFCDAEVIRDLAEVFCIDGIVRHNLIKASIRENWKVCVCVCVCMCGMYVREREKFMRRNQLLQLWKLKIFEEMQ